MLKFGLALLPTPLPGVFVVQYADVSVYVRQRYFIYARHDQQLHPEIRARSRLFNPVTKEANIHPNAKMDGAKVGLVKTLKLLGVFFKTMYTMSPHQGNVKKATGKVNALKSLAGSAWGQDKEALLITYKAVVRSTLECGASIWSPIISPTSWMRLQTVREHSMLLTKQHTASCYLKNSPGHRLLDLPPPQRQLKLTHL